MNLIKQLWRMIKMTRRVGGWRGALQLGRNAPKYVALFGRLLADPRVPIWSKVVFVGALAFAVSPLNIPNFIPVVGAVDDISIALFAGSFLMKQVPAYVLAEHKSAAGIQDNWDTA